MNASEAASRIFCALDATEIAAVTMLADKLKDAVGGVKLGKAFFTANGPTGVMAVRLTRLPVFLDLKFHDIPNTVAGAVRATGNLRPAMLTVHASGGGEMMRAAVEAAGETAVKFNFERPLVLAVTVLTSLGANDLEGIGVSGGVGDQVRRLAGLARESGADGAVCSPHEVAMLRDLCGPEFKLVVPGIRPAWAAANDQKRVATPAEAIARGADILVVGRPITQAGDPAEAARRIAREIASETCEGD